MSAKSIKDGKLVKKEQLNKYLICFSIILLLILISVNLDKFALNNYADIIVKNTGVGFGLLKDQGTFIKVLSFLIIVVVSSILITILNKRNISKTNKIDIISCILILSGSLSNLYERFVYGFVIDYIHNPIFPTFNLADSMITAGAILILSGMIFENRINS